MIRVEDIIQATCQHFGFARYHLLGESRVAKLARARQIAMYLSRAYAKRDYAVIGRMFGRHHTTIMSGVKKIEILLETGHPGTLKDVREIVKHLIPNVHRKAEHHDIFLEDRAITNHDSGMRSDLP